MGFVSDWLKSLALKSYLKDADRLEKFILCLGPSDLVQIKISVTVSLVFLVEESKSDARGVLREVLECLYENVPPRDFLARELPLINSSLINYKRQASAMNNPVNKMVAAGLQVWLLSIRSLIRPELLPCARRVWACVDSADKVDYMIGVSDVARFLGEHPLGKSLDVNAGFQVPATFADA